MRRFHRIASWCNGSTADSESACYGSSPYEATIGKRLVDLVGCWVVYADQLLSANPPAPHREHEVEDLVSLNSNPGTGEDANPRRGERLLGKGNQNHQCPGSNEPLKVLTGRVASPPTEKS